MSRLCDILRAVNGAASHYRVAAGLGTSGLHTDEVRGVPRPRYSYPVGGFGGTLLCWVGILRLSRRGYLRESGRNPEIVRLSRHGGGHAASVGCANGPNWQKRTDADAIHARREQRGVGDATGSRPQADDGGILSLQKIAWFGGLREKPL